MFFFPRAGIKGLFVLMPILGVGWILGLFALNGGTKVFLYAFAIVNGFQVRLEKLCYIWIKVGCQIKRGVQISVRQINCKG